MHIATKIALTLATAGLAGVVLPLAVSGQEASPASAQTAASTRIVDLEVTGMTSPACPTVAKTTLGTLAGVLEVEASYEGGSARVTFDPRRVDPDRIIEALEAETGLRARVIATRRPGSAART